MYFSKVEHALEEGLEEEQVNNNNSKRVNLVITDYS